MSLQDDLTSVWIDGGYVKSFNCFHRSPICHGNVFVKHGLLDIYDYSLYFIFINILWQLVPIHLFRHQVF